MKTSTIVFRSKLLPISFRLKKRVPIVLLILILVTLTGMVMNTSLGEYPTPPHAVIQTVF